MDNAKQFLELVVRAIVDHPEDVAVEMQTDLMGVLMTLHLHREDMGQVIGRQGTTINAIRGLLRIVGIKNNARINLKIAEPEGGRVAPKGEITNDGLLDFAEELKL